MRAGRGGVRGGVAGAGRPPCLQFQPAAAVLHCRRAFNGHKTINEHRGKCNTPLTRSARCGAEGGGAWQRAAGGARATTGAVKQALAARLKGVESGEEPFVAALPGLGAAWGAGARHYRPAETLGTPNLSGT